MKKEVYSLRKFGKLLAPAVLGAALLIATPASADEVSPAETPVGEGLVTAVNTPVASDLIQEWGQPTIENGKLVEGEWEIPADAKPLNLVEDTAQGSTEAEKKAQAALAQAKSDVQAQEEKLAASEKNLLGSKNKVVELEKAVQKQEELVNKLPAAVPELDLEAMKKGDFSSAAGEWKAIAARGYKVQGNTITRTDWGPVDSDNRPIITINPNGELRFGSYTPIHLKHSQENNFHGVEKNPAAMSSYRFEESENVLDFTVGEALASTIRYQRPMADPALAGESARLAELKVALAEAQEDLALNMAQVEEAQAALAVSRQNLRIAEKQVEVASQGRVVADVEAELAAQKEELAALKDKYVTVIDFEAISQGDFSSLAGEWTTEEGTSFGHL